MTDTGGIPVSREMDGGSVSPDAARIKHTFFRQHIFAANYFADRARQLENRSTNSSGDLHVRHRAYVTASVLAAAAFLEASINELYLELHTVRAQERTRLPRRVLALLGRFWSDAERSPVLQKYQVVLMVADAERFDERRTPFQDADSLMKLRDVLVHFRPERPDSRRRQHTIEQRLRTRFEASALAASDSPWFPDLCLGAGCAEWAVQAADEFSEQFCKRLSLPSRGLAWCEMTDAEPVDDHRTGRPAPNARPVQEPNAGAARRR